MYLHGTQPIKCARDTWSGIRSCMVHSGVKIVKCQRRKSSRGLLATYCIPLYNGIILEHPSRVFNDDAYAHAAQQAKKARGGSPLTEQLQLSAMDFAYMALELLVVLQILRAGSGGELNFFLNFVAYCS